MALSPSQDRGTQGAKIRDVKVSVILPTFNEAGNIVELIGAIKKQVPASWEQEIVVVDDNSRDGTLDLVREAWGDDPTVKTILRTSDRGLGASIGAGTEAATGDYVLIMDTDFTHRPEEIPSMVLKLALRSIGKKVEPLIEDPVRGFGERCAFSQQA